MKEEFVRFWLLRFRKLDMTQPEQRQALVDTFINAIYLYDDKVLITFNYKEGTETVAFGEAVKAEKSSDMSARGAPPGTRTLGPLIKRNQRATIVNFRNCANSSLLSFHRKFVFFIRCILCTCHPLLHPLSSRSDVQKVCKNVQSQNQPLKTGIDFLCKAEKMVGFEPKTAAAILSV